MRLLRLHLTVSVLTAGVLALSCGEDDAPNAPHAEADPGTLPDTTIASTLVFTRAGATVVAMGETPLYCCGLYDPGFVNERAMRIVSYDPDNLKPGWQILILVDRVAQGAVTTLPTAVVPPSKVAPISMFVADFGNDLSSDTEDSSGTITVHSFQCTSTTVQLDFSVDAVLGSEFAGGASMTVQGRFQATLPANPCP